MCPLQFAWGSKHRLEARRPLEPKPRFRERKRERERFIYIYITLRLNLKQEEGLKDAVQPSCCLTKVMCMGLEQQ